jgi:hypothetical protein
MTTAMTSPPRPSSRVRISSTKADFFFKGTGVVNGFQKIGGNVGGFYQVGGFLKEDVLSHRYG